MAALAALLSLCSLSESDEVWDYATAKEHIREHGYAHVRLGGNVTALEAQGVAMQLMEVEQTGSYNGGGGVSRATLFNSSFLDAGKGAPSSLRIQFHHEMAYSSSFPKYVTFAMFTQAAQDGTTLLIDSVKVAQQLSASLKAKMRALGVQYVRLLHDESKSHLPEFYNSWQSAFQTSELEEAFRKAERYDSYLGRHHDGRLRHVAWAPLFHTHPSLGELYFSSILNRHPSWQDGHEVFEHIPHAERPYQCFWGDGSELSAEELSELREAHDGQMERLRLEQGDIVVLDNLRVAHGRTTYEGKRLLGLLLSDMIEREAHRVPPADFELGRAEALAQRGSSPDGTAEQTAQQHCGAAM